MKRIKSNIDWLAPLGEELFDKVNEACHSPSCSSCPYNMLCDDLSNKHIEILSYFMRRGYMPARMERKKDLFLVISAIQSVESTLSCEGNCQSCECKEECEYIDNFAKEYYKTITPYLKTP